LTFKAITKDWMLDNLAQLFKEGVRVCMELMRLTSMVEYQGMFEPTTYDVIELYNHGGYKSYE
jgi:hypothetical protein